MRPPLVPPARPDSSLHAPPSPAAHSPHPQTAEMYPVPPAKETQGLTDRYIGSWLKTGRVKREDVVIATKVRGGGASPPCGTAANTHALRWQQGPLQPARRSFGQLPFAARSLHPLRARQPPPCPPAAGQRLQRAKLLCAPPPQADARHTSSRNLANAAAACRHPCAPPQVSGYSVQNSYVRSPPETTRVTAKQVQQSVDASLARLGVDHVDLLQIHWSAVRGPRAAREAALPLGRTRAGAQSSGAVACRCAAPGHAFVPRCM